MITIQWTKDDYKMAIQYIIKIMLKIVYIPVAVSRMYNIMLCDCLTIPLGLKWVVYNQWTTLLEYWTDIFLVLINTSLTSETVVSYSQPLFNQVHPQGWLCGWAPGLLKIGLPQTVCLRCNWRFLCTIASGRVPYWFSLCFHHFLEYAHKWCY